MMKLLDCADEYLQRSTWKDLALVKICCCAVGVLFGLGIAKENKRSAKVIAGFVFVVTFLAAAAKWIGVLFDYAEDFFCCDDECCCDSCGCEDNFDDITACEMDVPEETADTEEEPVGAEG